MLTAAVSLKCPWVPGFAQVDRGAGARGGGGNGWGGEGAALGRGM